MEVPEFSYPNRQSSKLRRPWKGTIHPNSCNDNLTVKITVNPRTNQRLIIIARQPKTSSRSVSSQTYRRAALWSSPKVLTKIGPSRTRPHLTANYHRNPLSRFNNKAAAIPHWDLFISKSCQTSQATMGPTQRTTGRHAASTWWRSWRSCNTSNALTCNYKSNLLNSKHTTATRASRGSRNQ